MSTENTPVETEEQNLDDFASEFFSGNKPAPDPAKSESQEDDEDDVSNATPTDDTHSDADADDESADADTEDEDALASEEEDDDDADDGQPKKTRFQKRIDELTAKAREEERQRKAERLEFESRIAELEKKLGQNGQDDNPAATKTDGTDEPSPNAKNEDGTDKYPLGEYDPQYIKDMAKYTFEQEFAAREAAKAAKTEEQKIAAQKAELEANWTGKLANAQERYPDFREKGETLLDTFAGIDASYGEYLSTALMALDNGPDVLYYLASNPEEADAIVASGPMKATVALGRIDSQFGATKQNTSAPRKASKAPPPPPRNKGSAIAKPSLNPSDDDVDLDTLARELAKKSYR